MKCTVFAPLALILAPLSLAGCESKEAPATSDTPTADAPVAQPGERANAAEGIAITDARLVLPAVKGNPGAVYFTLHNDSANDETIGGAAVKGAASAMIHQSTMTNGMSEMHEMAHAVVPAHGTLAFAPGGLHVMAMDLDDALAKGGTAEVTLDFENGDKAVFPAEILAAGDAR
jgi:copper(I)-binding protein